jgi:nicotinamidase-related amidase
MRGLVVIDMQNWMFRTPERAVQVAPLVANINALAAAFSVAGLPVFDVRTIHKGDRSTWSRLMLQYDYPCLLEGTDEAALVADLVLPADAQVVVKTRNSAFLGTDFAAVLAAGGIDELVLTGVLIDGCVGLTSADAAQRGIAVTFVDDAIGHAVAARRATLFEWLTSAYELSLVTTVQIVAALLSPDGRSRVDAGVAGRQTFEP